SSGARRYHMGHRAYYQFLQSPEQGTPPQRARRRKPFVATGAEAHLRGDGDTAPRSHCALLTECGHRSVNNPRFGFCKNHPREYALVAKVKLARAKGYQLTGQSYRGTSSMKTSSWIGGNLSADAGRGWIFMGGRREFSVGFL